MHIIHVHLAHIGLGMSGGDVCTNALIKYFSDKKVPQIVITSWKGRAKICSIISNPSSHDIQWFVTRDEKDESPFGIIRGYIQRTREAWKIVRNISLPKDSVIICHSDFFPNSILTWLLSIKHPSLMVLYRYHLILWWFRKYGGLPNLRYVHHYLNQILYDILLRKNQHILTVNPHYSNLLHKKFPNASVYDLKHFWSSDVVFIEGKKIYDVVWIGRFHKQKWIQDLLKAAYIIKKKYPSFRMALAGGGNQNISCMITSLIHKYDIADNVDILPFVAGDEKNKLLGSSKIFVMSSYNESFGLVLIDALYAGLPIITYDLPVYTFLENHNITVPLYDTAILSQAILSLLKDKKRLASLAEKSRLLAKNFTRDAMWEEIYNYILKHTM